LYSTNIKKEGDLVHKMHA